MKSNYQKMNLENTDTIYVFTWLFTWICVYLEKDFVLANPKTINIRQEKMIYNLLLI